MVLGLIYGLGSGILAGLAAGYFVFPSVIQPRSFQRLDISADFDDEIPEPSTDGKVSQKLKTILGFTDEWAKTPDYQRLTWFNHLLKTLWPHASRTIVKEVMAQAKPALIDVCNQVPMGLLESIDIDVLEMGETPMRMGGIKVYESREDNLITEGVLIYGSGMRLRVVARIRIPNIGYAISIPIEVSNIQMRAVSRITIAPMVETLPCVGGVSVTLLEAPYFDAVFRLMNSIDILSIPGIHDAVQFAAKYVLEGMLVYPNKMDFPVMENFGVTPPPLGMLEITIDRAEGLPNSDFLSKSDPYCELSVREGRVLRTRTIDNDLNPKWDQSFNLLVDDLDTQSLLLVIKDDDFGFEDDVLGVAEVDLADAECILNPRQPVSMSIKLMPGDSLGNAEDLKPGGRKKAAEKRKKKKQHSKSAKKQEKLEELGPNGRVHIEVRYLPFVAPEVQEEAMKKLEKERLKNNAKTQLRRRATKSTMDMRGVLTVTVHRCINLEEKSGQVDAYIRMTLYDPSTGNTEAFRTSTQINDPSPRYNQKFDFIDVPAISHFTATVFDKSGLIESRLTMTPWKQKHDTELGSLRLNVEEIARNKTMKDVWPLQQANKGDIELTLTFQPVIFEEDEADDVLSDSSAPSMQPSAGSLAQQSAQGQLPGEAPRSGSYAPEAHSQKELGNAVGTAIGKPRVGSRTMMSPQQAAADEQKTQQRVADPDHPAGSTARPAVQPPHH